MVTRRTLLAALTHDGHFRPFHRCPSRSPHVRASTAPLNQPGPCDLDGDPSAAADIAAGVFARLPDSYRTGLVRSRAVDLQNQLTGRHRERLADAIE
ncbi:hypothetical protein [Streptomyces sp. NPDC093149]|uniref:hypothetical protein n=1 Tax=Streptomyces sp. NPDC093149 TaxID=3366031 RepID=UPI003808A076